MYKRRNFEIISGILILIIFTVFIGYIIKVVDKNQRNNNYVVSAYLNEVGGLAPGSEVLIKGVMAGSVEDVVVDPQSNKVKVKLQINNEIKIPVDSEMIIKDTDFLSGRKVELKIGEANKYITNNGIITYTKDYEYLEDKINKIIFSSSN